MPSISRVTAKDVGPGTASLNHTQQKWGQKWGQSQVPESAAEMGSESGARVGGSKVFGPFCIHQREGLVS